ncbi:MAG: BNR repeat-containing protein, partial [Chitinophagaceae bacterium]
MRFSLGLVLFLLSVFQLPAQPARINITPVAEGWASNSINAVAFRKNSLVTYKDTQFVAFYNKDKFVVVGKRRSGNRNWEFKQTLFKGNATDAHNSISIMIDGDGFLHIAWDHHSSPINYSKSMLPGSLEFRGKMQMTGINETKLTYPEFYKLTDGNLLFFYRNGASGKGNLVINRYDIKALKWTQLHTNLVDGEGIRNAYWQACVDSKGEIHISWVWRESPDVASNHDMCYAKSKDGGYTWEKSTGEKYILPITAATAEYACRISQKSELINQTSMCTDEKGNPYIATYWKEKDDSIPQYQLIYRKGNGWNVSYTGFRHLAFSLSGSGTKQIPIARPQVIVWTKSGKTRTGIVFRDAELDNRASMAICKNLRKNKWSVKSLLNENLGSWEPTLDSELWKEKGILNLFIQNVAQADTEGITDNPPQMIR